MSQITLIGLILLKVWKKIWSAIKQEHSFCALTETNLLHPQKGSALNIIILPLIPGENLLVTS